MTIECAVLGMLSEGPLAGYDVKKRIQGSPFLPWSGNNNQVYRALSGLLEEGRVTNEVHHQDGAPSRKVYTITPAGRAALARWLEEPPEEMGLDKPVPAQLRWVGNALGARRVDALLEAYARQLRGQLETYRAQSAHGGDLDAALAALVDENARMSYRAELDWAERARSAIEEYVRREAETEETKQQGGQAEMNYEVIARNGMTYLHYRAGGARPESIGATQIVGDCIEQRANRVLIDEGALPEAFFRLSTGVAGDVMQKLVQYRVKAALVMDAGTAKGKFRDMMIESNRGGTFRSFSTLAEAERWLMEGEQA